MRDRPPIILSVVVAAAGFALLAAGCGGGGSAGVASGGSATTTATQTPTARLVAFSHCMRANGVPSFPDPQQFSDGSVKLTIHQLGAGSQVQTAMSACHLLLPDRGGAPSADQTRTELADELSFARCMRRHGVSGFPDPKAQGGLTVEMVEAQGIDIHSPTVLRVVQHVYPHHTAHSHPRR